LQKDSVSSLILKQEDIRKTFFIQKNNKTSWKMHIGVYNFDLCVKIKKNHKTPKNTIL